MAVSAAASPSGRRVPAWLWALIAFALGMALTLWLANAERHRSRSEARRVFVQETRGVAEAIRTQLDQCGHLIRAFQSIFLASQTVTEIEYIRAYENMQSNAAARVSLQALAYAERDQVNPRAGRDAAAYLWKQTGITDPLREVDCAEIYVPFSWFEPMWLENLGFAAEGQGWKLTQAGETALDGRLPVNMSGGVLSSNPIGASGMIRFAEAALQVRGEAGEHQVADARRALGHAYGGGSQFFAMWLVGSEKPG